MRVVHVTEVSAGGVRRLVADFAEDQVARGLDVHVVGDASLADLPGTHHLWRGSRRRPASALADWVRLHRLLRRLEPDVVHLHSSFAGAFARTRPPLRRSYAVVYQPHSWAFDAVGSAGLRRLVAGFERWAGRRTELVATNCVDEIHECRRYGVSAPAVALGVPIDLDFFRPATAADRGALRSQLGLDGRAVVLCLGRVVRQKGYDILLPEWERQPIPGAMLHIVGPGDTADLEALAPTQWGRTVTAAGSTDDPRSWLQAADLLLLPSRYEGQSVTVSEALACGLPVVAFAVNGARQAICDEGAPAGAVAPVGDAAALLAHARRRLDDADLRAAEALRARERAERDNLATAVFDRLAAAYTTAIHTRRTRRASS